jgi:hypothetical protein
MDTPLLAGTSSIESQLESFDKLRMIYEALETRGDGISGLPVEPLRRDEVLVLALSC